MRQERVSLICTAAIISLFLFISFAPLPFHQQYYIAVRVFLAAGFLAVFIRKRSSIFRQGDLSLWFFLAAIGINVFFAQQKDIALRTYLDLAIPMFCIYYLTQEGLVFESQFKIFAKIVSVSSILVCILAVFESIFAFNPIYEYWLDNYFYKRYIISFVRPVSTQFNPAVLGSYLLACLPFNFFLLVRERRIFRVLSGLGVVLNIVIIILTFSRGVFLGFVAMVMFYLFVRKRYVMAVIFLAFIVIFSAVSFYLPSPFNRLGAQRMLTAGDGMFSDYRFTRCLMTRDMLEDFPLTGLGFQHFRIRFREYYPFKHNVLYEFMIADNMYLTILAETGAIGFLGFFMFLVYLLAGGWRRLKLLKDLPQRRFQLLIVLSAFVGLLVNMGAYDLFYWPNQYTFFCILAGLLGVFVRGGENIARP